MAAVIVHGGAYAVPDAIADASVTGCVEAAEKAYRVLQSGQSAVDAGILTLASWLAIYEHKHEIITTLMDRRVYMQSSYV